MFILSHISEVFMEAVIQLHLLFLLIGLFAAVDSASNSIGSHAGIIGLLGENKWLIWLSFSISVSSATFGLAKFLKNGPFKILNEGLVGIGITMLIISSFMTSKAVWVITNTANYEYGMQRGYGM